MSICWSLWCICGFRFNTDEREAVWEAWWHSLQTVIKFSSKMPKRNPRDWCLNSCFLSCLSVAQPRGSELGCEIGWIWFWLHHINHRVCTCYCSAFLQWSVSVCRVSSNCRGSRWMGCWGRPGLWLNSGARSEEGTASLWSPPVHLHPCGWLAAGQVQSHRLINHIGDMVGLIEIPGRASTL